MRREPSWSRSVHIPRMKGYPGVRPAESKPPERAFARKLPPRLLASIVLAFVFLALLMLAANARADSGQYGANLRSLFDRLDPSVVTVNSSKIVGEREISETDREFAEFMRSHLRVDPGEFLDAVVGSGFIVDSHGLIITAAHLLEDSVGLLVELHDRRLLPAELVGIDRQADIALLKVQASNLVPVRFGDSSRLALGDPLFAIGAPFGLQHTVSAGMVSGHNRVALPDTNTAMIQTDLSVNPGSSGSPLFDARGDLVGMNTMILTYNGGFNGVSLAVPSEILRAVIQRIQAGKASPRGIGAKFRDLPPILAQALGIDHNNGVIVTAVDPLGLATAAGLQVGDVIVACDGRSVDNSTALLATLSVGEAQTGRVLTVIREHMPVLIRLTAQADRK